MGEISLRKSLSRGSEGRARQAPSASLETPARQRRRRGDRGPRQGRRAGQGGGRRRVDPLSAGRRDLEADPVADRPRDRLARHRAQLQHGAEAAGDAPGMRRPPALRWLSLVAMAFGPAAHAQTEAPLTYRAISAMTPAAVGRRLLGPERGADIVRVEFLDFRAAAGRLPGLLQLFLYTGPVPLGPTYCSQRRYYHALASAVSREHRPLRRGEPLRIL